MGLDRSLDLCFCSLPCQAMSLASMAALFSATLIVALAAATGGRTPTQDCQIREDNQVWGGRHDALSLFLSLSWLPFLVRVHSSSAFSACLCSDVRMALIPSSVFQGELASNFSMAARHLCGMFCKLQVAWAVREWWWPRTSINHASPSASHIDAATFEGPQVRIMRLLSIMLDRQTCI